MLINSIGDFRRAVRAGPYMWPGGYPLYLIMGDGEACSFRVAKDNRRAMLEALRDRATSPHDQWLPVALEVNWENGNLWCAHRSELIESAYAEPEEPSNEA